MKLVRFGAAGAEKPGIIDRDGTIRDLSSLIADLEDENLAPHALAKLRDVDVAALPKVERERRR